MDEVDNPGEVCAYTVSDGEVLNFRRYRPDGEPRAYIMALHGIQSHSGWYGWSSSRLARAGYDVRFFDRRGSGMNERQRRHDISGKRLCEDVIELLIRTHNERQFGSQPIVLTGVSWAGKLLAGLSTFDSRIIDGLLQRYCDGIALLYPAIFTHFDPGITQRAAIRFANVLGQGHRTVPIPLNDPSLFTDDPQRQAYIRDDPLTLRRVSLCFLAATLDLTEQAKGFAERYQPPTFVALAGRDEIVDLDRTRQWAAQLSSETTRIVEYPQARHTLEFDPCREQFVADLMGWIESLVESRH